MPGTKTAMVVVRHSKTCPDRAEGPTFRKCGCRKAPRVYDGVKRSRSGKLIGRLVSAKTRSWERAEKERQDWLNQFDPDKAELKRLRAVEEAMGADPKEVLQVRPNVPGWSAARRKHGMKAPHVKWHERRGIKKEGCMFCFPELGP
jgi:hypothetical protein